MLYQRIYKDIFMQAFGSRFCADLEVFASASEENMAKHGESHMHPRKAMKLHCCHIAVYRPSVALLKQLSPSQVTHAGRIQFNANNNTFQVSEDAQPSCG